MHEPLEALATKALTMPLPTPVVSNIPSLSPLLSHLPSSLSAPVHYRRRRFARFRPGVVHLNNSTLTIHPTVAPPFPLYIRSVVATASGTLIVRGETGMLELRLGAVQEKWRERIEEVVGVRQRVLSDFVIDAPVGKGGGGTVFLVREKHGDGQGLAMKVVKKTDAFYSDGSLRHAMDERVVLEMVRGFPFVIRLRYAFQTDDALYMVSDFCKGGNLRRKLTESKYGRMEENDARTIMAEIIMALEYLHGLNVMYRDLKPENILFGNGGEVRLCDFGLSKVLRTGRFGRTKSFCGSTSYMSPEIVKGKDYGIMTDLWSLGALFYRILVGRAPFDESIKVGARNEARDIERRIVMDELQFPNFLSEEAREILEGLLRKDESKRMNLCDLKETRFFEDTDWDGVVREGYRKAAAVVQVGGELDNFDSQRLQSHGVVLKDREIDEDRKKRPLDPTVRGLAGNRIRTEFIKFGKRRGSTMRRRQSSTSIVGFGFSSAENSEASGSSRSGSDGTRDSRGGTW